MLSGTEFKEYTVLFSCDSITGTLSAEADKTLINKDNASKEDIHIFRLRNVFILRLPFCHIIFCLKIPVINQRATLVSPLHHKY